MEEKFTIITESLLFDKRLDVAEKVIVAKLQEFIRNGCEAFPTYSYFSDMLNISKRAVMRKMSHLKELGVISRTNIGGDKRIKYKYEIIDNGDKMSPPSDKLSPIHGQNVTYMVTKCTPNNINNNINKLDNKKDNNTINTNLQKSEIGNVHKREISLDNLLSEIILSCKRYYNFNDNLSNLDYEIIKNIKLNLQPCNISQTIKYAVSTTCRTYNKAWDEETLTDYISQDYQNCEIKHSIYDYTFSSNNKWLINLSSFTSNRKKILD